MLRDAVSDAKKPGAADAYTRERLTEMLQFFELMNGWAEQTRKLPTPAVIAHGEDGRQDRQAARLVDRAHFFCGVISVITDITDTSVRPLVASVWLVHGLYNKLLGGSPRHLAIVQSVPGLAGAAGERVLTAVGLFEVALALWILSGWRPRRCAATQTVVLLSMNVVELTFARHLLLSPAGLLPLNLVFLTLCLDRRRIALAVRAPRLSAAASHSDRGAPRGLPHAHLRAASPTCCVRCCRPGWNWTPSAATGSSRSRSSRRESLHPAGLPTALRSGFLPRRLSRVHDGSARPTDGRSAAFASCAATPTAARWWPAAIC